MPEFLADRDLGKRVVDELRGVGLTVHTLADIYGEQQAMRTRDVTWIEEAGKNGWAALTKNKHIRNVTAERDAVVRYNLALFALSSGNLGFAEMAGAFLRAVPKILEVLADRPGGSLWIVHRDGRLELMLPHDHPRLSHWTRPTRRRTVAE